jgi:SET domain-containing protein
MCILHDALHSSRYNAENRAMATKLVKFPKIDERYACYRLAIRESKIHRFGVYAAERIPANRKVIEYTGERISRRETKRRGNGRFTYLFSLDSYWTLDGAFGGSGAEIINHSCDPRAIRAGEELTVDYRFSDDIERVKCCCGAKNCRGEINFKES